MIPCQELRIGNYVMAEETLKRVSMIDQNSTVSLVTTMNNKEAGDERTLDDVSPVMLSDDILKRCGFVYHDYFKFWQLIEGVDENRSEIDMDRDYNILDFMRKPIVKKVASLHQLQNVYFLLKGKELRLLEN